VSVMPLSSQLLSAVETELKKVVNIVDDPKYGIFHHMLAYHMGWEGEGAGSNATGKRIRPILLLLTTYAAGRNWEDALPAAAAVELIHNFSLIHDDIEDNSSLRRGRPTVWDKWGVPLALNAGDAMFTLAHLSIFNLEQACGLKTTLKAATILQNSCLELTKGQHLDISYESRNDLVLDDYWSMVSGKTASLLSTCTELGAAVAEVSPNIQESYRKFGYNLGMAFQALDDLLGIWGDAALTGKSNESDLISGKKSLPVLYALDLHGPFSERWRRGAIQPVEVKDLAHQLESEGARDYTQETAACFTDQALKALHEAGPTGEGGEELIKLTNILLQRKQ
jgi:geranylgeranyl diphosphate synthase, type I